ncbi:MAG: hypothetical protein ACRDTA_22365 [Pseudonocardiaceae bacterium]
MTGPPSPAYSTVFAEHYDSWFGALADTGDAVELPSQDDQLRCFANVARRLAPGGLFVFDANLPEALFATQSANGQVLSTSGEELVVRYRQLDPAAQRYVSHYVVVSDGCTRHMKVSSTTQLPVSST